MLADARSTRTSSYKRSVDGIFSRVERFDLVYEYRVRIKIGNSYFISNKTYSDAVAADRAARRLAAAQSHPLVAPQQGVGED